MPGRRGFGGYAPQRLSRAATVDARTRQYELYVRTTEMITDRQAAATRFYTTVNTTLIGALGWAFFQLEPDQLGDSLRNFCIFAALACALGFVLTLLWHLDHRNAGRWQKLKYEKVRQMEAVRPELSRLYAAEWEDGHLQRSAHRAYAGNRVAQLFFTVYAIGFVGCLAAAASAGDLAAVFGAQPPAAD
ncbi:MAG: hypothetical protein AAFR16_14175 [Pseudomonadota bacterium]